MKFAVAVIVTLALALGAQSSILPLIPGITGIAGIPGITQIAGGGLAYTAVSSPAAIPAAVAIQSIGGPALIASPPAVVAAAPQVVVAGPGLVPGGSYVAKTRGAVHTAPLPGHIQSVANLNAAPAPGTL